MEKKVPSSKQSKDKTRKSNDSFGQKSHVSQSSAGLGPDDAQSDARGSSKMSGEDPYSGPLGESQFKIDDSIFMSRTAELAGNQTDMAMFIEKTIKTKNS